MYKIVFFIFLLAGGTIYAQDYPKYKTKKAEGTVVAEPKEETNKSEVVPANTNDADFAALMEKGMGLGREKKYAEAAEIYTQAIPLSNEENAYWPYFQRGLSYYVNHEPEKALADYNAALTKKMPSENIRGNIHMFRAFVHNMLGHKKEACADYKIARELGAYSGDHVFDCE